jgi:ribosomal protein L40E
MNSVQLLLGGISMRVPTPLVVIATMIALPALIPLVVVQRSLYKRRFRVAAKSQACLSCGAVLGIEALHEADERWRARLAELHRNHPGVRFRLVRLIRAICVRCGASFTFRADTRTLAPTSALPAEAVSVRVKPHLGGPVC